MLEVVADVLTRAPAHPDRDATARLRDALIVDVNGARPKDTWPSLETFAAAVEQALAEQGWWPDASAPAAVAPTSARRLAPDISSPGGLAPGIHPRGAPHALYAFHKQFGGPDAKTLRQILKGEPVIDDVLMKLVEALTAAGHRVTFGDIPRD